MVTRQEYLKKFPVSTSRLGIRPYTLADAPQLVSKISEVYGQDSSAQVVLGQVSRIIENETNTEGPVFGVRLGAFMQDGTLASEFFAHATRQRRNEWSISYFTRERFRGQGLMVEIVGEMAPFLRKVFGAQALVATTSPYNRASQRVLKKAGFAQVADYSGQFDEFKFCKRL